jgi:hypothetical protein
MNLLLSLCLVLLSSVRNSAAVSVAEVGGSTNTIQVPPSAATVTADRGSYASPVKPKRRTSTVRLSPEEQEELRHLYQPHHEKQRFFSPPGMIRQEDLPIDDSEEGWQSLNPEVEFIPSDGIDPRIVRRFLEQNDASSSRVTGSENLDYVYNVEPFAYGVDNYDEYQQAWRLLGFIVDCNPLVDDDYYGGGGSGSGDQSTEDACARYVLWAAVSVLLFVGIPPNGCWSLASSSRLAWDRQRVEGVSKIVQLTPCVVFCARFRLLPISCSVR